MWAFVISVIVVIFLAKLLTNENKPQILGVYEQGNFWSPLKRLFMFFILSLRQMSHKRRLKLKTNVNEKFGLYATEEDCLIDCPQPLQENEKAIDAVYFNGSSKNGAALVCGLARRPKGVCNSFLYLKVEGEDLMLSPELPFTTLLQTKEQEGKFEVCGIRLYPIERMKSWTIKYDGPMKLKGDPSKSVNVTLNATWTAVWNHFNYDSDMSPLSMSRDMAREFWNKEYFTVLKDVHQTHYEQHGDLTGTVKINDKIFQLNVECVRDHSFGWKREWKLFHRYALHYIALENGDRISVGNVCMPACFSSLTIGFICRKEDQKIYPIDSCDLMLYQHGENLTPPLDYAFQFKAGDKTYTVQVGVIDSPTFYIGHQNESRVVERLASYKVNGVIGWGAAEWQYTNVDSKPLETCK